MNLLKCIVLLITSILITGVAKTQTFHLVPNDTIERNGLMDTQGSFTIYQDRITTDTLVLKWKKVSEFIPLHWEARICDNSFCYASLADSGLMNSGDGFLEIYITSHIDFGTAIIRYAVWDVAYPLQKDTLTYIIHVNGTSGINEEFSSNGMRVYPNPTLSSINLYSKNDWRNAEMTLRNVIGELVFTYIINNSNSVIDISQLKPGIYFLQINDTGYIQKIIKQ